MPRLARRGAPRVRLRLGAGGRGRRAPPAPAGRRGGARRRRLRRHVPPDRQGVRRRRAPVDGGRPHRPGGPGPGVARGHGDRVGREPHQPGDGGRRHRGGGRGRARPRRAPGGRQHVRHAVPAATAGPRRRRGGALLDQVPGRAFRRGRRVRGAERRRPGVRARIHAERGGGHPVAGRLLPRPARGQDAGRPHGPPLRQRPRRRRGAGRAPRGRAGAVAGPARAPRARRGQAPDARLRRHGVVRGPGRRGGSGDVLRAHRGVHAGRVAGCGGVAGRAPRPHDARLGCRVGARGLARPRAAVGRHRVGVRPGRRRPPGLGLPDRFRRIPCGGRRRRPVRCRPDGGAARPVRLPASPRGHGGDHRGLRRRPSRPPGGDRRGPPARR